MFKRNILIFIFLSIMILLSCQSQELQVDNTKPMYGEVKKGLEHKKIDEDFIKECLLQFGSIDSSITSISDNAWRYYYNNDLETAMKRFNQVWLLNPEYPDSYFGFATLLESQGKYSEAKRFYEKGFEKDSKFNRAETIFLHIATCKEQLNDIEGSINAYTTIVSLNPKNAFAHKKIGYFQMESKNYNESLNAYNNAIDLDPTDAMTFNNRGYLHKIMKNYNDAIKDYSSAIDIDSNYISALVNRGITNMEINHFEDAKKDFHRCVLLDENSGELRRFLALSELKLNDVSSACENLKRALELVDVFSGQLIEENCTE